jgi:hypothetical protein
MKMAREELKEAGGAKRQPLWWWNCLWQFSEEPVTADLVDGCSGKPGPATTSKTSELRTTRLGEE